MPVSDVVVLLGPVTGAVSGVLVAFANRRHECTRRGGGLDRCLRRLARRSGTPVPGPALAFQVAAAFSAGATSGLLVVLAADWLRIGPAGFGLLLAAIVVGAATGPLLLRPLHSTR